MKDSPWLYGLVQDDVIYLEDLNLYNKLVSELNGRHIQVMLVEKHHTQTDAQRNTYFGVLIGKYLMNTNAFAGWTKDEIDWFFRNKFLIVFKRVRRRNSDQKELVKSHKPLSKLSRKDFSTYIEQIIDWCAQHIDLVIEIKDVTQEENQKPPSLQQGRVSSRPKKN